MVTFRFDVLPFQEKRILLKSSLIVFILTSLLASCAVGPDYFRPDMNMPERYQGRTAMDQRTARGSTDLLVWWESFDDPQLTRFVTLALEQNLDLAQASARVAQAGAGLGAATAALVPACNISVQASRAYQSVETPLGGSRGHPPITYLVPERKPC